MMELGRITILLSAILLASTFQSLSAHSEPNARVQSEYQSLKSNIKLLRNRSSQLHAKSTAFKSTNDHALLSLKKREKEDNAAVRGISSHMKSELTHILERVEGQKPK